MILTMERDPLAWTTIASQLHGQQTHDAAKIHSCGFCSVQEIDPTMKALIHEPNVGSLVKYRGSRVLDGASRGCAFFQDMITYLEPILKSHGYRDGGTSARKFQPEEWICMHFLSEYLGAMEMVWAHWTRAEDELPGINEGFHRIMATYWVMACKEDPSSESILVRPFSYDFKSSESNSWVRKRLEDCKTLHKDCTMVSLSFIPTRLLRLQRADDGGQIYVRLETTTRSETGSEEANAGPYSTLSYCWGGEQKVQLNCKSEETLKLGILASSLPKTLLDAALVTWNLGLRLLWIDCLCIRQDDPEDKALEIARMPAIFGNSFITISAVRASHSGEGFLHRASLPSPAVTGFKIPFACPDGRLGSVILSRGNMNMPLNTRAWTLQEHLLAPRVLQFTDFHLHWTCREIAQSEHEDKSALPLQYIRKLESIDKMYRGIRTGELNCRTWMRIIEEFTRRDLTYSADKLPAISGIAENWAAASEDHYAAGLWESHLPLGLLWTSGQPFLQTESKEYRAPSWTWASVDGQVDWFDHLHTEVDPKVSIESCAIIPTYSQAPYGTVVSGSFVIHGLLQETVFETIASSTSSSPISASPFELADKYIDLRCADIHADFWEDALASKVRDSKLYCLQICCFEEQSAAGPAGLILTTKDEQTFCRVGVFFFQPLQPDDVQRIGDFSALLLQSEGYKRVQRRAFTESVPRSITIL